MQTSPFRTCDYCGRHEEPVPYQRHRAKKPWTLHEQTRKLSCVRCRSKGEQEDAQAGKVITQYREVLSHRLVAEPSPTLFDAEGTVQERYMQKYRRIKENYPDAVLLFRMGDWYYMLQDDAEVCSRVIGTVSGLQWLHDELIQIGSFPYHALEEYLPMLVKSGRRVAICDQMEGPPVPGVVMEPTDAPLRCTHRIRLLWEAEELRVHKEDGQYYGLDGTWSIDVQDPRIRAVVYADRPRATVNANHGASQSLALTGTGMDTDECRLGDGPQAAEELNHGWTRIDTDECLLGDGQPQRTQRARCFAEPRTDRECLLSDGPQAAKGSNHGCTRMDTDECVVGEPVEQYRRIKPLYKDALLILRDHQGYLMLYRDAARAAEVLQVEYNGTGSFRIAKTMLERVLDELVKAGHRVAVVIDPHVDDPRMAKQVDLWDMLSTDATMVGEPDAGYGARRTGTLTAEGAEDAEECQLGEVPRAAADHLFADEGEIRLCLIERPHGTVVEAQVNWLGRHSLMGRVVHLDLRGGRASSETGYRSVFLHLGRGEVLTEDHLIDLVMDVVEERFAELHPGMDGNQQTLF